MTVFRLMLFVSRSWPGTRSRLVLQLGFVVAVAATSASAQSVGAGEQHVYPIDLTAALRLAGEQNTAIAEAEARVREASGDKLSAYERFFPTLSAEWLLVRHEGRDQRTAGQFLDVDKQFNQVGGIVSAKWDLNDGLFAILAAKRRFRAAEHERTQRTETTLLEVAKAYYSLVEAAGEVRIGEHVTAVAADFVEQTERSVAVGVGSRVDVLQAETALAHERLSLHQVRENALSASARLVNLLSLDEPITLTPLDTTLAPLDLVDTTESKDAWLREAGRVHPALLAERNTLAASRWEMRQAVWGPLLPEVEGRALFTEFGPTWNDLRRSRDYIVSVRWTIGPGGLLDLGRIRSRSARARVAAVRAESAARDVAEGVSRSYARLRERGTMLVIARAGLQAARQSLELTRGRRQTGIGMAFEVIAAVNALKEAETDYTRTVVGYNLAQVEALKSLGRLRRSSDPE